MKATYVEPKRTPFTPLQLARAYVQLLGNTTPGHIAVLMAHCALETGRDVRAGLIGPSCWNWNLGNVKAGPLYDGSYTCILLNEVLFRDGTRKLVWFSPEGQLVAGPKSAVMGQRWPVPPGHPQTRMRAFTSLAEGVRAKVQFLSHKRFQTAVTCAQRGDPAAYVDAIHAQKYFTADPAPYQRAVVSLTRTYMGVAEEALDEEPTLPDPAHVPTLRPVETNLLVDLTDQVHESMLRDRDLESEDV